MIHAMIDLETLSTKPNAAILTIGGVKFNPYNNIEPSQGLYHRIDVDSQSAMGRDIDPDTVEWWGQQAEDVREEALGDHDRIDLKYFIKQLNKWCVGVDVVFAEVTWKPAFADPLLFPSVVAVYASSIANNHIQDFMFFCGTRNTRI